MSSTSPSSTPQATVDSTDPGSPESANNTRLHGIRHHWPDRLFHWVMALSVLVLMFSAFLPVVGIQFDWIPWHWIAGVVLTLIVLFHIVRAVFVQGLSKMLPRAHDFSRRSPPAGTDSKYDIFQKSYHWGVAVVVLALIVSGIPMLLKLDTLWWDRNPGLLSDTMWGYVYVVHGIAALVLIFMLLLHLYFSFLPEHKQLLKSMITGRGPLDH